MSKRIIVLALVSLFIMSFATKFHESKAADAFKIEQIGVRM